MKRVIVQKWEEHEPGWGFRPDGYSLHITEDDRKTFVDQVVASEEASRSLEDSRPDGDPYTIDVEESEYEEIAAAAPGMRRHNKAPGSQGTSGWKTMKT